jgi:arginine/lysine/ornithine decarboxylase
VKKLDQTHTPLLSTLQSCADRNDAPFYTPGHKRGRGTPPELKALLGSQAFQADLPELPELDNLFAPQSVIQAAQELAAEAFGAEQTRFLTNGSTCGVIAGILTTCNPGEKIILPRNVHQSVISGLILSGAMPVFIQPEYDSAFDIAHSITPEAVEEALAMHPDAKAVMMVYPTYYGVCGDVKAIAHLCHQHHIPLLVDEAHGSHFAFHPGLPTPSLAAGVDLSVQSIHKTLSAFTQAAMLHVQGSLIDRDRLTKSLQLVQSTSPNYLLLASLDAARHQMATQGKELMEQALRLSNKARFEISQILHLATLSPAQATTPGFISLDQTRLTVNISGLEIDGFTADEILHEKFGVTCELPSLRNLTFIITFGNQEEDIERLVSAFEALEREVGDWRDGEDREVGGDRRDAETRRRGEDLELKIQNSKLKTPLRFPTPDSRLPTLSPREAFSTATETLPITQSIDRISAETVCPYPPGIPVLLPGEIVTGGAIAYLQQILAAGGIISGCVDPNLATLRVVKKRSTC